MTLYDLNQKFTISCLYMHTTIVLTSHKYTVENNRNSFLLRPQNRLIYFVLRQYSYDNIIIKMFNYENSTLREKNLTKDIHKTHFSK